MRPKASQKSLLSHLTPALGSGSIHISCCTVAVKKQTQGNFHFQACSWRVFSAGMQQRKRQCVNAKFAQYNPRGESSTVLDPFQMCGSSWDKFGHFAAHLAQAAQKINSECENTLGEDQFAKFGLLSLLQVKG